MDTTLSENLAILAEQTARLCPLGAGRETCKAFAELDFTIRLLGSYANLLELELAQHRSLLASAALSASSGRAVQ